LSQIKPNPLNEYVKIGANIVFENLEYINFPRHTSSFKNTEGAIFGIKNLSNTRSPVK
jgi:hypothetical protein